MNRTSRQAGPEDAAAAQRIGQAPTTTDVTDPERSSRNTAAGSGSEPGERAACSPLPTTDTP